MRRKNKQGRGNIFVSSVLTCIFFATVASVFFAVYVMFDTQPTVAPMPMPTTERPLPTATVTNTEQSFYATTPDVPNDTLVNEPLNTPITPFNTPIAPLNTPITPFNTPINEPFEEPEYIPAFSVTQDSSLPAEYFALPFFLNENAEAYDAFRKERPDLNAETVVWMVNAHVHVPFYSQISVNEQPNPLFISPAMRLPNGFIPLGLLPVNNADCHLRATPETVEAFVSLRNAARQAGHDLSVTSAYRSAERQATLWDNGGQKDGSVARPFHSEHQTGRALDLWGPGGLMDASGPSTVGLWVGENAHEHGFIVRYRAETTHITGYIHEPWHITYVGTEIAKYMHENNILSLEEYVGRNPGASLPG